MSAIRTCTIEELGAREKSALATGPFGSAVSSKNFRSEGVPMLRGSNLSEHVGTRLDESELVYLDPELAAKFSRSSVQRGDIVFTCWGSVGQIGFIDSGSAFDRYIVSNKQMKLTPDPAKVDPLFLYYNLSQPKMISEVKSRAIGSTIPGFNLGQLRAILVDLPDLPEQRAIAEILGALDEKIAANTKLAATAEELMKSRWIQVIEHLGDDLEHLPIGSCGKVITGKTPPTSLPANYGGETPFVTVGDLRDGIHVTRTERTLSDQGVSAVQTALLPKDAILMSCIATIGEVGVTTRPSVTNQQINALVPDENIVPAFAYFSFKSLAVELHAMGTGGSVYTNVSKSKFSQLTIPVPPHEMQLQAISGLDKICLVARRESITLAITRDALLPNLMSGRLGLKAAEKLVEEVT